MLITFTSSQFEEITNVFYSPAFKIDNEDQLLSVEGELSTSGDISLQVSMNETSWYDVTDTAFTCNTANLQTYTECHPNLFYRLKATTEPVGAKVLI